MDKEKGFSKYEVNEVLHAAGCARNRGHSYQCALLIRIAKNMADTHGYDICTMSWWRFANGKV